MGSRHSVGKTVVVVIVEAGVVQVDLCLSFGLKHVLTNRNNSAASRQLPISFTRQHVYVPFFFFVFLSLSI